MNDFKHDILNGLDVGIESGIILSFSLAFSDLYCIFLNLL